jgi:hypothetical protein
MLHLDRDANAGFPPGYRDYIETHRTNRTMQLTIKAQGTAGQMDRLGRLTANVADPIHLIRLKAPVIRH